ncbi:MAG: ribonuclease R [Patescibacteria group bacterium]|nr:ribonuclease R [Patescibacteria group bacterium]
MNNQPHKKQHDRRDRQPQMTSPHTNTIETGKISTNRKGFGFINFEDSERRVVFEPGNLNTALAGDTVEFQVTQKNQDGEFGRVVKVIERGKEKYVGIVMTDKGHYFLSPDDKRAYLDFIITPESAKNLKNDLKVQVKLLPWTDPRTNPQVELIKILGPKGDNNVEMEAIVLESGFETGFPADVEREAAVYEQLPREERPGITTDEIAKRRDMRDVLTFTIDPFDAKDFDDAISFRKIHNSSAAPDLATSKSGAAKNENLYEIGVHIADVSHYVRPGTAINREALNRATSIYLVDRTIPMLPEVLSNEICSLMPDVDRLAFSAVFTMNDRGEVLDRWFGRTVIHSAKRFTYETAQDSITGKSKELAEELIKLNDIAKILKEKKFAAGAIEFEQDEIKFKLDENGKPIGVYRKERFDAHKLVEEYMLLANREVAKFIHDAIKASGTRDTGAIYRIHDLPDPERMTELADFAKALGYTLHTNKGKVKATDIKALLKQIEGTPHQALLSTAMIRSMQKAVYSTKNIGHFGLAFDYYTHFTSPIRRYPDLLVHRILASHLHGEPFGDRDITVFANIAEHSTEREIEAAKAERNSIKLKQVEYMADKIGKTFDGTISGVSEWGIYIEDNETKSEGMVNIRNLGDDFWKFDKKTYCMIGERTGTRYTLGDAVRFKVMSADTEKRMLDYEIVV